MMWLVKALKVDSAGLDAVLLLFGKVLFDRIGML